MKQASLRHWELMDERLRALVEQFITDVGTATHAPENAYYGRFAGCHKSAAVSVDLRWYARELRAALDAQEEQL